MAEYMLLRYHSRRTEAIKFLGGKCVRCETTENLEFDHIDPKKKLYDIGKVWSFSKEKFWIEINKCQLLCEFHHKEKTTKEQSVEHGQGKTGKRNCYCDLCKPLKTKYTRDWKRRNK